MSVQPAALESEYRAATPRAAAEESNPSPEKKFQDAVDSRRAERAQAASKSEDARDTRTRVGQQENRSEDSDAARSDAAQESEPDANDNSTAESSPQADSTPEPRDEPRDSRAAASAPGQPAAIHAEAVSHRTLRASKDAGTLGTSERGNEADPGAPGIPAPAQAALEAFLSLVLPHVPLSGSSAPALGPAPATTPATGNGGNVAAQVGLRNTGPAEAPIATLKATAAAAIDTSALATAALGTPERHAGESGPSAHAVDPRSALAAFAAPQTAEVAAPPPPVAARLAPAELPSLFDRLAVSIDVPERHALVHLEPADLGPLRISLSVDHGGHVKAELHAERPDGYAALQARLPELHQSLIDRGFTSANVNLSLGLPDPHSRRSGAESEPSKPTSAGRRALADAEVRALVPVSAGAIDMWA